MIIVSHCKCNIQARVSCVCVFENWVLCAKRFVWDGMDFFFLMGVGERGLCLFFCFVFWVF